MSSNFLLGNTANTNPQTNILTNGLSNNLTHTHTNILNNEDTNIKLDNKTPLFNNKILLLVILLPLFLFFIFIIYNINFKTSQNNKCPKDCKKYINGNININGKICKVPVICPTNCVYEKEDDYVKYGDCNCDLEQPIKKPNILIESKGDRVIKCPHNILCNDCKLVLKIENTKPLNPIKTDLILNFEPLKKSIYITKYYLKLHAYSNNNNSTVQIHFINNNNKKLILLQEVINISNNKNNKEIIFNINMNQPMLINSNSSIKLLISNPNKDDIIIDYLSSLIIEYKNKL